MSKPFRSILTVVAAVSMALTTAVALPGTASAAPSGQGDPAIAAALLRIAEGKSSPTDIALIASKPEIAKLVADPSKTTIDRTTSPGLDSLLADRKAGVTPQGVVINGEEICGNWIEVTITVRTLLGFVLYKWMAHYGFCIDFQVGVVSRWDAYYDRLSEVDPTIVATAPATTWSSPMPNSPAVRGSQRHLQQCVLTYGCWANHYPWSEVWVWGTGSWGWRWGA
ncbi:hypothetical protein [Rhizocola hellebori]|nr:hypothetical protein [Rhizocola hellebori]